MNSEYKDIKESDYYIDGIKLELHEEQLDMVKQWVQTGEVSIHKEVVKEEKNIIVPVTQEVLVIEKKVMNEGSECCVNPGSQTIRIPISEERVEIIRHPVTLENISVYKSRFQELQHIEEKLKKEIISVNPIGDVDVIEKEIDNKG